MEKKIKPLSGDIIGQVKDLKILKVSKNRKKYQKNLLTSISYSDIICVVEFRSIGTATTMEYE